ncbi:hypothetical protein TSAR_016079 [Trichomalopsis sarcophagae]|uniref:Peptidase M12B domain-containing protein n=1 Tax=Trichomalopsis sarcophagae TaxID=543379 RepID=A0A232FHS3_9HYME|nr:hypothetical protein TSAR_016079 [Trichomalopsis sarcophagae]
MKKVFVLLCAVVAVMGHKSKVHEQMTQKEIHSVFGKNAVPDYEVVPVAHAQHKRSADHRIVRLTSFERDMTLYLEPTDGFLAGVDTPVFKARSNASTPTGVEYERVHNAIKSEHNFYQDPENLAALVIKDEEDGNAVIHGVIDDYAIRPLPKRLRSQFSREKRQARDEFLKSNRSVYHQDLEDTHHHVVFKLPSSEKAEEGSKGLPVREKRAARKASNAVPDIIHPQVLVVLESTLFDVFKQDVDSVVDYVLSYWNAVDLRYRVFRSPDVRLNIAAIILSEDHNVTPYIAKNHVNVTENVNNKIEVTTALRNKSQFFFPETTYNDADKSMTMKRLGVLYDMVITMSPYDMCQFPPHCLKDGKYVCRVMANRLNRECITLGYAYYTGACAFDGDEGLMEAVGIVEDQGGFSGIIPTAHEVGHLMGASHSATNVNQCPVDDGYIMSYKLTVSSKSFMWSNCSESSIKKFLANLERAQCLFNTPDTVKPVARILPGKVFSRTEQCDRITGTHSCDRAPKDNDCVQLYCTKQNSNVCMMAPYAAVPEGTPCGTGMHCINARCVREDESTVELELGTKPPVGRRGRRWQYKPSFLLS